MNFELPEKDLKALARALTTDGRSFTEDQWAAAYEEFRRMSVDAALVEMVLAAQVEIRVEEGECHYRVVPK